MGVGLTPTSEKVALMPILGVGLTSTSEKKVGLMPILGVGLTSTSEKSRTNANLRSRTNAYI